MSKRMVVAALLLTALAGRAGAQEAASPSAEDRYLDAVRKLEVERKPEAAVSVFRGVADDDRAEPGVRARALVGLARAERLLGHRDAAEARLREVLAKHADLAAVCAEAQAELASLAGAAARFATGIVDLAEGQFLDLDTGGVFARPETPLGGRAEVARRGDDVVYFTEHADAREMDAVLPWIADAPWTRVTTDGARTAWLQRLPMPKRAVFRFVVRLTGTGAPLPAPKDAFCVGRDGGIDVRFAADARYVRYRVERRVGADGVFEPKGEIAAAPFADGDAKPSVRYGYRITGVTERGDEGLPATVQGTTKSRGVVTGSIDLKRGRDDVWFDFLEGAVATDGGDVAFHTAYGNYDAVGFLDAWGRVVLAAGFGAVPRTVWAAPAKVDWPNEIRTGQWFAVPLSGGGIARCRVTIPSKNWEVHLDYDVDPDADAFGTGVELAADERARDAVVRVVGAQSGFSVTKVTARDPRTDDPPDELALGADGAVDPKGGPGALREYSAAGEDAFGRRSVSAMLTLNRLSAEPHDGTFEFHYQQGYSFELDRIVDPAEADVVFSTCAGGISSITLTAPGGIVSLETVLGREHDAPSAERLFELVLGAVEKDVRFVSSAHCDSRSPRSDVAVLRTRHGGWARVAITERRKDAPGGWQKLPAVVRFTWNPRAPIFANATAEPDVIGGLRLAPGAAPAGVGLPRGTSAGKPGGAGGSGTPQREMTLQRLAKTKLTAAIAKQTLDGVFTFLKAFGVEAEADPALRGVTASAEVEFKSEEPITLASLLDELTKQAGVAWTVTETGAVRIVPAPK